MQDSIQVHLKAGKGPIVVMACEVGSGDAVTSDPGERSGFFLTLEESRIRTSALRTGNLSTCRGWKDSQVSCFTLSTMTDPHRRCH